MPERKKYTAIDLLDKVFEFIAMTPESQWSIDALKSNPPRFIRFQQIESLMNAFIEGKKKYSQLTIQSFLAGNFIKIRTENDYNKTIQHIKYFVKNSDGDTNETRDIRIEELIFIYLRLVDYKKMLQNIISFNRGWLEAGSIGVRFSIYLTDSISKSFVEKSSELDMMLEQLINPKRLTFSEKELISKYNYPTEDLADIDSDYS